jgi:hypothetical protein
VVLVCDGTARFGFELLQAISPRVICFVGTSKSSVRDDFSVKSVTMLGCERQIWLKGKVTIVGAAEGSSAGVAW